MRDSFLKSLTKLAEGDSNVMLLTADLGFGVFEDFAESFPGQYINVGVAEQNMTGIATGLALEGKTVFTYSIGNFPTLRCLEQIRNDACYHDVNVNIVSTGGGFSYGALGMSHHTTEDLSIMRSLPAITIIAPCDIWEAEHATTQLAKNPGVGYLRIDKTTADSSAVEGEEYLIGKARRVREGSDVSLICTGGIIKEALLASELLKDQGINCRVISMHTIKPLDYNEIEACVNETGGIITIEENTILGGLGGAVAEYCLESGFVPKVFKRIGLNDIYSSIVGTQEYLRNKYNMDADAIVRTVHSLCAR
ncbi:MAG: transketolase [Gammaproteobacteria bacterium]|nr:transketolase [Gammaproteobacteria bacterium]